MAANKKGNEYEQAHAEFIARTPKAVLAAIAIAYASRNDGEEVDPWDCAVEANLLREWEALYLSGVVPQRPPVPHA